MTDKKTHWLSRRLKELNKTKLELATVLGIYSTRLTELEDDKWKFQASHIKKVAQFLNFDKAAFLDFISGDITEEELWNAKPPVRISDADLQLLKAVKTAAISSEGEKPVQDHAEPDQ